MFHKLKKLSWICTEEMSTNLINTECRLKMTDRKKDDIVKEESVQRC